ncbi:MAG TPA: B12-binding domain-containing protein [Pyrinomonadaceae bacterium]|nr:B12-binding domain-containing protein [Pyrinomonadaceae bacterium]
MSKAIRGRKLTSKEAARVLGVSEASVKRWADSGLLPMEKTAGGHRRFRPEDVAVVRRAGLNVEESRLQRGRSAAVLRARPPRAGELLAPGREGELVEETFRALTGGREEELSAMLVNLHLHGQSVGAIADGFLCAAMRRVGDLWHAGELSVAQEHVATRTANVALENLRAVLDAPGGEGLHALCCSVEDDFHDLPLRLAALTLEAAGLEVFNLGVSTPFPALSEAVERFRPDLVCVSSTVLTRLDRAVYDYAAFRKVARRIGATVVLGGAGFAGDAVRRRLPADLHADSFRQLEEFTRTLAANETSNKGES